MGVYCYYQAMPVHSRLFQRLKTEQQFCVMYGSLIHRPAGPYDTVRLSRPELDDLLNGIAENSVFGSRAAVDRVYADLLTDLARAAEEFPGLPQRGVYIELYDLDQRLGRLLRRLGHPNPEPFAETLILPNNPVAPDSFNAPDISLELVPRDIVTEAAEWLLRIEPEQLGPFWPGVFPPWRTVYLAAAEHGEGVIAS